MNASTTDWTNTSDRALAEHVAVHEFHGGAASSAWYALCDRTGACVAFDAVMAQSQEIAIEAAESGAAVTKVPLGWRLVA